MDYFWIPACAGMTQRAANNKRHGLPRHLWRFAMMENGCMSDMKISKKIVYIMHSCLLNTKADI
jgi:hypothetical protein